MVLASRCATMLDGIRGPHRDRQLARDFPPDKSDPSAVELHLHARPEGRTSHQRSPDARHVRYGRLRDHPVRPRAPARRDGRPQGRARAHRLQGWGSGGPQPPRAYRRASQRRARGSRVPRRPMSPPRSSRRSPTASRAASSHLPRLPPRHPGLRGLHHRARC